MRYGKVINMEFDNFEQQVLDVCQDKKVIFIFISKDDEVETRRIINGLFVQGKTIVVPITEEKTGILCLCEISSLEDLSVGAYGICEPKKQKDFSKENIGIFFVPGTKFDKEGNRKGRGKGYFDRFLADIKGKKPIVGLCHQSQFVEKLTPNSWDIPVDSVIVKSR